MAKSRTDVESVVKLVINGEQAKTSMKEITDSIRKYEAEIKNMRRTDNPQLYEERARAIGTLRNALRSAQMEMRGVTQETVNFGTSWKDIAKGVIAGGGILAIVGQLKSIAVQAVETYTKYEKFNAILTNTLGSTQAARLAFSDLKQFAKETPFALEELTASYIKLVNRGFQPTMAEMRKMADLAASQGKDMDMLVEAILDAQVGENERLKEFGIRASKNGDTVSLSFKGITKEVNNTEEAIRNAILSFGELDGVVGSTAKTSETLGGKLSNLGDSWDQLLATMGEKTGGMVYSAVTQIGEYLDWLTLAVMSVEDRIDLSINQRVNENLSSFRNRSATEQSQIIEGTKLFISEYTSELNKMPDVIKGSKASQYFRAFFGLEAEENMAKVKFKQQLETEKRTLQAYTDFQKSQVEIKKKAEEEKARISENKAKDEAERDRKAAQRKAEQLAKQLEKEKQQLKDLAKSMQEDFDLSKLDGLDKALAEIDKKYNPLIEKAKKFRDAATVELLTSLKNSARTDATDKSIESESIDDEKARKEAFNASKNALDNSFKKRGTDNASAFANGDISEEDYNAQQYDLESERLIALSLLYESYGESSLDFEQQLADRKIAIKKTEFDQKKQLLEGEQAIQAATIDNFAAGVGLLKGLVNKRGAAFKALLVAEKAASIAQIIMNTQAEISGYYAKYSLVPGGVAIASGLALAAKVRAGIGIAAVAATGIKELNDSSGATDGGDDNGKKFAKGGFVPNGPSHAGGGIKMIDGVTGAFLGEMEGGEPIISRETYLNNKDTIDALLYSGQRKNGARVNIDMGRMQEAERMYRNGGFSPVVQSESSKTVSESQTPVVMPPPIDLSPMLDRMDQFIDAANDAWNLRNFKEKEARYNQIREDAGA